MIPRRIDNPFNFTVCNFNKFPAGFEIFHLNFALRLPNEHDFNPSVAGTALGRRIGCNRIRGATTRNLQRLRLQPVRH
ncbi:hypothetical protein BDI4_190003 [Burkholderia diffusa]|nr:hypothetical protein BDI4_190003 [Burkholderia diffusa]